MMEDMNTGVETSSLSGGSSAGAGSRWNPTKEQIDMLESLYMQGIRTPSAEQIQQITCRLRAFGHIEGKNVFYWFQNHKARQRQKQKQEHFAYFNRLLRHHTPPPPPPHPVFPPCHNVIYSSYYSQVPQTELGFHPQQFPKPVDHQFPATFKTRKSSPNSSQVKGTKPSRVAAAIENRDKDFNNNNDEDSESIIRNGSSNHHNHHRQETLDLFPLHPTGILESRAEAAGSSPAGLI